MRRLLQKSIVSQSCLQDCTDFAERMKRKALRVRPEGSIPPYVIEAESRKQHSDSPLCNSLIIIVLPRATHSDKRGLDELIMYSASTLGISSPDETRVSPVWHWSFLPMKLSGLLRMSRDSSDLCFNMAHPAVYLCTVFNKSDEELWIQMTY